MELEKSISRMSDSDDSDADTENSRSSLNRTLVSSTRPPAATKPLKASAPNPSRKGSKRSAPSAATSASFVSPSSGNVLLAALLSSRTVSFDSVASDLVERLNSDKNAAEVELINLLFRAVGGSPDSELPSGDAAPDLDAMDDEQWVTAITSVVSSMSVATTASAKALKAGKAAGADAGATGVACITAGQHPSQTLGRHAGKFHGPYASLWRAVGSAALKLGAGAVSSSSLALGARLDADLARDLILRATELVGVGQPDVRYAATLAVFGLARGVTDELLSLRKKEGEARRAAANAPKGGPRKATLDSNAGALAKAAEVLQEILTGPVFAVVFTHRYRDSNDAVRALCLDELADACVRLPDVFLNDLYLKYFGWMMSDTSQLVRASALAGLNRPFEAVADGTAPDDLDLNALKNVVSKFLPRLVEVATRDVNPAVQLPAMRFLLSLLREGFLDDVEDEKVWDELNVKCLDPRAAPALRQTALAFVVEQLEAFDDDGVDGPAGAQGDDDEEMDLDVSRASSASSRRAKAVSRLATGGAASFPGTAGEEQRVVRKLEALASWAAHALTAPNAASGSQPLNLRYVDFLVESLRSMPEHASVASHWAAFLRAVSDDAVASTASQGTASAGADEAKRRVLLRMLMAAVKAEVAATAEPDFVAKLGLQSGSGGAAGKKKDAAMAGAHERVSVELLKALPSLFTKFSGDSAMLSQVATLPRYLAHSVFSLPQRKSDVLSLLKQVGDLFLKSTDERVLGHCALALEHMREGEHARTSDAMAQVQKITDVLVKKISDLVAIPVAPPPPTTVKKGKKGAAAAAAAAATKQVTEDSEFAFGLALTQLRILAKRVNIVDLVGEDEIESFVARLVSAATARLEDPASTSYKWYEHTIVVISEALTIGVAALGWKVARMHDEEDERQTAEELEGAEDFKGDNDEAEEDEAAASDTAAVSVRDLLVKACQAAFDVRKRKEGGDDAAAADDNEVEENDEDFADFQWAAYGAACTVASDLRALCSKTLRLSSSASLRSLALVDDSQLIAGMSRYLKMQDPAQPDFVYESILPVSRDLIANWEVVNRKEAGAVLANITGAGPEAAKAVQAFTKIAKAKDPVKLLEAHMAALRQCYEEWLASEPAEPEGRMTDDEMQEYEEQDQMHTEMYAEIRAKASKLSSSLGVGKLADPKMVPAMVGFLKEGLRYSFSTPKVDGQEEESLFGGRLSFLGPLKPYIQWVKKNSPQRREVVDEFARAVRDFKNHLFYNDVEGAGMLRDYTGEFEAVLNPSKRQPNVADELMAEDDEDEQQTMVQEQGEEEEEEEAPPPRKTGGGGKKAQGGKGKSARELRTVEEEEEGDATTATSGKTGSSGENAARKKKGAASKKGKKKQESESEDEDEDDEDAMDQRGEFEEGMFKGGRRR